MQRQETSPISAEIVARSGKKLIRGHVGPAPYRVESALADTPSHTAVLNQCGAFGRAVRHPAVSELVVEGDSAHREEAVESVLFEERQRERFAHVACVGIPPRSTPVVGGLPRAKVIQAATLKFSFACSRSFPCNPHQLTKMASDVYVERREYALAVVQPEVLPPSAEDRIELPNRSKE